MYKFKIAHFLPLFLAAAGCDEVDEKALRKGEDGEEQGGNSSDEDSTSKSASKSEKSEKSSDSSSGSKDKEPPDFDELDVNEYFEYRKEYYCEAIHACEPDAPCGKDELLQFRLFECEEYDINEAELCLIKVHKLTQALGSADSPQSKACVAAMNPPDCDDVIREFIGCNDEEEGRPINENGKCLLPQVHFPSSPLIPEQRDQARRLAAGVWLRAAQSEHGSIAAFSRLSLELLAHDAPIDLVERCHAAALDEINHSRICLDIANDLLDTGVHLGSIPLAKPRMPTLEQLAKEALLEGCIGEGTAAARASLAAAECKGKLSDALQSIATDETRHAQLAWATLDWLLSKDSSLVEIIADFYLSIEGQDTPKIRVESTTDLKPFGVLPNDERNEIRRLVMNQLVSPTLCQLLRKHGGELVNHSSNSNHYEHPQA